MVLLRLMTDRLFKIALVMVLCTFWSSSPAKETGNDILEACTEAMKSGNEPQDHWKSGFCWGYINGLTAMEDFAQFLIKQDKFASFPFCFQREMTYGQMVRVVVSYLEEHPETLHRPAAFLVLEAFTEAFPCRN
jgi:hypothetical protein